MILDDNKEMIIKWNNVGYKNIKNDINDVKFAEISAKMTIQNENEKWK